jgi:hypothetical protein
MENISRTFHAHIENLSSPFQARFKHEFFIALLIEKNLYAINFCSNKWKTIQNLFKHILRSFQALIHHELFIEKTTKT